MNGKKCLLSNVQILHSLRNTYSDLIQLGILIVGIINLYCQYKKK